MVTRSRKPTKPNTLQEAATVLPFLLRPRPKLREFGFPLGFTFRDADCLQSVPCDVVGHQFGTRADTFGGSVRQEAISTLGKMAKRVLDLLISAPALVLLWPLMLVIAIAVKLESRGPALYASLRAGKNGVPFPCYKFRTMVLGADRLRKVLYHLNERCGPFFKIAHDPRVTPLGRFLRKYSLDELPQFWNVLKGDMSLVGPRPHPLEDVALYSSGHEQRLEVMPGMTGLWQVTARESPSFETCMLLDVGYIHHWSLLLDCKILLRTIPVVLTGNGQ